MDCLCPSRFFVEEVYGNAPRQGSWSVREPCTWAMARPLRLDRGRWQMQLGSKRCRALLRRTREGCNGSHRRESRWRACILLRSDGAGLSAG